MVVALFGKNGCPKCSSAKRKLSHLLRSWGLDASIELQYHDMETVDGLAEGMFYDVSSIPTTILRDGKKHVARWDGTIPKATELKLYLPGK